MYSSLTTETPASRPPPNRNFRCTEPGCGASYVRKEHLNRHSRQHQQQTQAFCEHCGHAFSRSDILRRHQKLYHDAVAIGRSRALQACDYCHSRRTRCKGASPCDACLDRGIPCTFGRKDDERDQADGDPNGARSLKRAAGSSGSAIAMPNQQTPTIDSLRPLPAEVSLEGNLDLWDMLQQYEREYGGLNADEVEMTDAPEESTVDRLYSSRDGSARELDLQRHMDDYFAKFHHQWPFLHRPAFQPEAEPRFLVLSMVMVSLWMSGEARAQAAAVQIHERFIVILNEQKDKWDMSHATSERRNATWPMGIYQSILLHVIFAMMRSNPDGDTTRSKPWLPLAIHELVGCLLKSCLRLGIFQYPKMLDQYDHVGFAFLTWVYVEEVKRFALVLFRVWKQCYGGTTSRSLFTASDLRFPLPESDYLWEADVIRELVRRREKELSSGSGVREEEQFWMANLGIDELGLAENWRELANSKGHDFARVLT